MTTENYQIEVLSINKLKPYDKNPRKNLNVKKVARSIKEFGFQQPIVVDRNMSIIVGHTRYEASKLLKLEKVPVIITDLKPDKAKAYRIADNRLNGDSEWNIKVLNQELGDLLDVNYDLSTLGFYEKELEEIIVGTEAKDIDVFVPSLEPKGRTQDITGKNILSAQNKEHNKFQDQQNLLTVVCPNCYNEFAVKNE